MSKQSIEDFNKLIEYIEKNLDGDIDYKKLAQILAVNEYTMHRIFLFVTGYTLSEYIRKRRLSQAAIDIVNGNEKIIDVAIKYGYDSSQSFSRAFKSEMGVNPTEAMKGNIKFFPKYELNFNEDIEELKYSIEKNLEFNLYGISFNTTVSNCHNKAPEFWKANSHFLTDDVKYGLLEYNKVNDFGEAIYYIAQKSEFENSKKISLPPCNYLVFDYNFTNAHDLDLFIKRIYKTIILNFKYELTNLPDIEEYLSDEKMKIYIPFE